MRALELAAVLQWLVPERHDFTALCVWCLAKADPHERWPSRRSPDGGACLRCRYTGRDVFVVAFPQGVA